MAVLYLLHLCQIQAGLPLRKLYRLYRTCQEFGSHVILPFRTRILRLWPLVLVRKKAVAGLSRKIEPHVSHSDAAAIHPSGPIHSEEPAECVLNEISIRTPNIFIASLTRMKKQMVVFSVDQVFAVHKYPGSVCIRDHSGDWVRNSDNESTFRGGKVRNS